MKLTKRQEKQLTKVFNNPKQLRKWVDEVYNEMIMKCEEETEKRIMEYLDIYSIAVAYTLRYYCGFGKKRLPKVMAKIWSDIDCFKDGYLSLEDCIQELAENGIEFDSIIKDQSRLKGGKFNANK